MEVVQRPAPIRPATPRVVIVDGDRRVQQSLADLLTVDGEVEVVGRAGDVRTALQVVEQTRPDVVLIDPRLPDADAGLALIGGLARAWPGLRIVLTGWSEGDGHAMLAGSVCYVTKGSSPEEYIEAVVAGCRD
jgi:DNA-binding NarL/FixJ family response regulator